MTPSGIGPAQYLSQLRHRVPQIFIDFQNPGKIAEETEHNV